MGNIFNMNNRFFQGLNKIVDCVWLSALFVIVCIPVFTIGSAVSALYYTYHKQILHNRGYVGSTFWESFKSNFKNATPTWLLQCLFQIIFVVDAYITYQMLSAQNLWGILFFLFLVMLLAVWIWALYCSCYYARFAQERKIGRKNAGIIAVANLPWSILIAVLLLAAMLVTYICFPVLLILPVIAIAIFHGIFEHIFRKYMSPEDIAREQEEYRNDDDL